MGKIYLSREKMADQLAEDDCNGIDSESIYHLLLDGCVGFNQYTDKELEDWYNERYGEMEEIEYTCIKPRTNWDE